MIDAQPIIFSKTLERGLDSRVFYKDADFQTFATDYAAIDIREWLNNDFVNTAFSAEEGQHIVESNLDNTAWSRRYSKYDAPSTCDKVFLLSYEEVKNPAYGFERQSEKDDALRTGFGTDYSFSQGLLCVKDSYRDGTMWWWLRSVSASNHLNASVNFHGSARLTFSLPYAPDCTDSGIRPALRLDCLD